VNVYRWLPRWAILLNERAKLAAIEAILRREDLSPEGREAALLLEIEQRVVIEDMEASR
jgi:hypothetical protein